MGSAPLVDAAGLPAEASARRMTSLARIVLYAFLMTFIVARVVVLLIMSQRLPDLYLYVGGTHVHHLNYGIFLLSLVGAYLLFARPNGRALSAAGALYGVGLGLTFDEFGLWVNLGGSYWQRASWDAVVIIAGLLALAAFAPELKHFRPRHWWSAAIVLVATAVVWYLLYESLKHAGHLAMPRLLELESRSPP